MGWEPVTSDQLKGDYTERMKVPGGYVYRCVIESPSRAVAMCFVPDYAQIMDTVNRVTRGAPVFVKGI